MNKADFVKIMADQSGSTLKATEEMVDMFMDIVTKQLKKGESITFQGFGTFETKKRAARNGVNPVTKEKIRIKAMTVPSFRAGKNLREAVAKK